MRCHFVSNLSKNSVCSTYIVDVLQDRALRAFLLQNVLGERLQPGELVLGLLDHPFESTKVGLRSTFVQKVDVDMLGEGKLALVDSLEESGFAAAVLAQESITTTV